MSIAFPQIPHLKIKKSDIWILAVCFILICPFFIEDFVEYYRQNGGWRLLVYVVYTFGNPLFTTLVVVFVFTPFFIKNKQFFFYIILLLVFLLGDAILAKYVAMLICGCTLKVDSDTVTTVMQYNVMMAAPISMILIIKQFVEAQSRLLMAEKEKKEAELKLLKQQIDPHFLFNNLNVLGALIEQDKDLASEYLNRFASLYRYIIRYKEEDAVLLDEEWKFTRNYIYLLQQRFGNAYNFEQFKEAPTTLLINRFVPPGAIQTLIENVVKHNQGNVTDSLVVQIRFEDEYLTVKNEVRVKLTSVSSTQTGLENLKARYQLLSDKKWIISNMDGFFEVKIPLLKSV